MSLINKLLKRHISLPQFIGYFAANLFGMAVVLLAVQFYFDVVPVFTGEDGILKKQFLVVSKHIGAANTLAGSDNSFSEAEINELKAKKFTKSIGAFHSSQYRVTAAMSIDGENSVSTDLFFDALPDNFVDVSKDVWTYSPGDAEVPIILPRSYLALYNFGFAQSRKLPKISEGLAGMIGVSIIVNSGGMHETFKGKVVGFSGRINSILVPLAFMQWSNARFAPDSQDTPSRLILETNNTADPEITQFLDQKGYEIADDQIDAGKITYFLKVVTGIVLIVGLVISILSFCILMLSIYLLVEKNSDKIENLLLIGFSPSMAARPYVALMLTMNAAVLVLSLLGVYFIRTYYVALLSPAFPQVGSGTIIQAIIAGLSLYIVVSTLNFVALRRRILSIWTKRLEKH